MVKFSIYLNRRVFVMAPMNKKKKKKDYCEHVSNLTNAYHTSYFVIPMSTVFSLCIQTDLRKYCTFISAQADWGVCSGSIYNFRLRKFDMFRVHTVWHSSNVTSPLRCMLACPCPLEGKPNYYQCNWRKVLIL